MLIGNVGQDPEIRYLDGNTAGNKVASFRMATTERYRDRAGELREITEWHNVVAWRNLADIIERFVKKGSQIFVEGRLRTRSWEDQNNNKRYVTEVLADNIQLLGRRPDGQGSQDGQGGYQHGQRQSGSYQAPQGHGGYQQGGSYQGPQNQGGYHGPQSQGGYQAPQPVPPQVPPVSDEDDDLPF